MTARLYAQNTAVPVERTRSEIQNLIERHGAQGFMFGSMPGQALIAFEMRERRLRFLLPLPTPHKNGRDELAVKAEIRRRWRALLLVLKSKLEAVASSIVAFDEEFLAHIIVEGNTTVGDRILPKLGAVIGGGRPLPGLLGAGPSS